MIKPLTLAAAVPLLLAATQAPLVDSATAMRCSAAFGIIANEQARGIDSAKAYPELGQRGREFFVQAAARLMDEEKLTREQLRARFKTEVEKLQNESIASSDPAATLRGIITPCLALLDAAVPPTFGRSE
jgi:hypothetical protein